MRPVEGLAEGVGNKDEDMSMDVALRPAGVCLISSCKCLPGKETTRILDELLPELLRRSGSEWHKR